MRLLRKHSLEIFCDSDPLLPKGGITENQQDNKSPLGEIGVGNTFRRGFNYNCTTLFNIINC
jgi:hypothetical protein